MKITDKLSQVLGDVRTRIDNHTEIKTEGEIDTLVLNEIITATAESASVNQAWKARATELIEQFAHDGSPFTSDHVLIALEKEGLTTEEPRALGSLIREAGRSGLIVKDGFSESIRPSRHNAPVTLWVG